MENDVCKQLGAELNELECLLTDLKATIQIAAETEKLKEYTVSSPLIPPGRLIRLEQVQTLLQGLGGVCKRLDSPLGRAKQLREELQDSFSSNSEEPPDCGLQRQR
jgi:hypothetical protein